ncbi:glycosyltransferase family 4 protein [Candidatus Roizmanbacteria bacterium]|nr:glycosyltransferase family 4 protein [Candidatus Roizmanbacteria bacterium]
MAHKTKTLIVTDYFYPHWTGISKSIFNLTQSLQHKLDFTVLTVKYSNALKDQEKVGEVNIMRTSPLLSFSRAKVSLLLILKFIKLVGNFDVIFINSPNAHILPISFLTKIFGKKLVLFHQGDLILPKGVMNRFIEKIFDLSTLISFSFVNKVSTYTRDYAEHSRVLRPFLNKFTALLLPIYIPSVQRSSKDAITTKLQLLKNQRKILFGFGGRFVEEKGFDILFDAIPNIRKKLPNAHFVFAGETNMAYENFFQKNVGKYNLVKRHITMLGLLNSKELSKFYESIDFIVIPSRTDCFNMVQAEAMLSGKPSIVSDIPGARYLVRQSAFGLTFQKENPADLATKLVHAVKNKSFLLKNYPKLLEILDNKRNVEAIRKYLEE